MPLGTLGLQKVATVVNKDNAAQVFIQGIGATTLEAMGVEEAAVVEVAEAQSNYGPQIAQLLDVEPEAILLDLTTEDGARFMQQAVARGYEGYFIAGDGGLSDNRLFELSQGAGEGHDRDRRRRPGRPEDGRVRRGVRGRESRHGLH